MPAERRSARLASAAPTASPATSPRKPPSARKPTSSRKSANRKKPATRKTLSSQPADDSGETPSGNYELTFRQLCEECPSECGSSSEESDEGFDAMRGYEYHRAQGLTQAQIERRYARRIRKLGKTVESMEQEAARSKNGQCWVEQTEEMDVEPIKPVRRSSEETSSSSEEESSSDSDSGMEF
ncbi:hypothetical protein EV715DRAFT_291993 [Schizophyllum commune]